MGQHCESWRFPVPEVLGSGGDPGGEVCSGRSRLWVGVGGEGGEGGGEGRGCCGVVFTVVTLSSVFCVTWSRLSGV